MYQERQSRAIAERVKLEHDAAEKRLAEMKAKLESAESAQKIDQNVIDKLVAEKTAEKLAELEEEKHALDEKFKEAHERHQAIERSYDERRRTLEDQVAAKIKEIEKAARLDKDVGAMEEERRNLSNELEKLRRDMEQEKEDFLVREKVRKLEHDSLYPLPQLLFLVKENFAKSPNSCGLSIEELADLEKLLDSVGSIACETLLVVREELDALRRKEGLRLVQ
jgi:chromosome segregation ATPase